MPTGHTAMIQEGCTFPEFVMECARAFGANIMLRDSPDAPIPDEYEPSTYHHDRLQAAYRKRDELLSLTAEEVRGRSGAGWKSALQEHRAYEAKRLKSRARYEIMLEKVKAWTPPTPDHDGLRDFMVEQINKSIAWDCDTSHLPELVKKSPEEWLSRKLEGIEHDIRYHDKAHVEEIQRTKERNEWNKALRESLEALAHD